MQAIRIPVNPHQERISPVEAPLADGGKGAEEGELDFFEATGISDLECGFFRRNKKENLVLGRFQRSYRNRSETTLILP